MTGYVVLPIISTTAPSAAFPTPVIFTTRVYITGPLPPTKEGAGEGFPSFPDDPSKHAIPDTPGELLHSYPISRVTVLTSPVK
jgi:hypothetical protein